MAKIVAASVAMFSGVAFVSVMLALFASTFIALILAVHWAIA